MLVIVQISMQHYISEAVPTLRTVTEMVFLDVERHAVCSQCGTALGLHQE